jgi:hypothetical protein
MKLRRRPARGGPSPAAAGPESHSDAASCIMYGESLMANEYTKRRLSDRLFGPSG